MGFSGSPLSERHIQTAYLAVLWYRPQLPLHVASRETGRDADIRDYYGKRRDRIGVALKLDLQWRSGCMTSRSFSAALSNWCESCTTAIPTAAFSGSLGKAFKLRARVQTIVMLITLIVVIYDNNNNNNNYYYYYIYIYIWQRVKTFCFVTKRGFCRLARQGPSYNNATRQRFETKPARQGFVTEGGWGPATSRGIDPSPYVYT